jgi:hypothetical protein
MSRNWRWIGGVGILLAQAAGATGVASGFGSDAQGWTVENGALSFSWVAHGGDPGGYLSAADDPAAGSALWFFSAPLNFLGDRSQAYGGSLAFSLDSSSSSAPSTTPRALVQLLGENGVLLAYGGGLLPGTDWTRYQIDLVVGAGWHVGSVGGPSATEADLRGVLGSLVALRINGDFYKGVETTGLDSVVLAAAPVPEPASVLLWLAGGMALAGLARRRGG